MCVQTQKYYYKETLYKLEASFYEVVLTLSPLWISVLAPFIIFSFLLPIFSTSHWLLQKFEDGNFLIFYFVDYFWLRWDFADAWAFSCGKRGLLLNCGAQAAHCSGFCGRATAFLCARASVVAAYRFQSTGSVIIAHRLSCTWNPPRPGIKLGSLNWQVDSNPAYHQGSPWDVF